MNTRIIVVIALALLLGTTSKSFAHGKKEHNGAENLEFDPVENEFGAYDPELQPSRTIAVSMGDNMRFTPDTIEVKAGEVIEFVVSNDGKLMHEFVLGTSESLSEHAAMMLKFPNMEHEEPYMAHVEPGKEMTITWQFTKSGDFEFGCLVPGHFDAGMKGALSVL